MSRAAGLDEAQAQQFTCAGMGEFRGGGWMQGSGLVVSVGKDMLSRYYPQAAGLWGCAATIFPVLLRAAIF